MANQQELVQITSFLTPIVKCCVCLVLPPRKIFVCVNGHNTCEDCFEKIPRTSSRASMWNKLCPVCRVEIKFPRRNISLEAISAELLHTCSDCERLFAKTVFDEHRCPSRKEKCPHDCCSVF
jgi:hypothetical protein